MTHIFKKRKTKTCEAHLASQFLLLRMKSQAPADAHIQVVAAVVIEVCLIKPRLCNPKGELFLQSTAVRVFAKRLFIQRHSTLCFEMTCAFVRVVSWTFLNFGAYVDDCRIIRLVKAVDAMYLHLMIN